VYQRYRELLEPLAVSGKLTLPVIPESCTSNYHLFHIVLPTGEIRNGLLKWLNEQGIHAVFHYVPLHSSPMGVEIVGNQKTLPVTDSTSGCLLRLPIYPDLQPDQQARVVNEINAFLS